MNPPFFYFDPTFVILALVVGIIIGIIIARYILYLLIFGAVFIALMLFGGNFGIIDITQEIANLTMSIMAFYTGSSSSALISLALRKENDLVFGRFTRKRKNKKSRKKKK